jgi:hypothetical protein
MKSPWYLLASTMLLLPACGGSKTNAEQPQGAGNSAAAAAQTGDDKSMCEWKNRKGIEVSETAGPGAIQPNVRRVYRLVGLGKDSSRILVCREVDTNLDGIKDTVRFYNDRGQSREEHADTNFDGKVDTWNRFVKGRLATVRIDRNHDGHADEEKFYVKGKLQRVRRDANFDRKWDTWEQYRKGRLERMGVDLDGDQKVDRWDKDNEWLRRLEQAEKKRKEEKDAARKKKAQEAAAAAGGDSDAGDSTQ